MSIFYDHALPSRVRLLILGGGIHGVGLLHDMASRGWRDIHLVEKDVIGSGTSSRSTKLIHGGLRYLQNIRNWGLVAGSLKERFLLSQLAPDLAKPLEFYLPVLKGSGMPAFILKTGLALYDFLAGKYRINNFRTVQDEDWTKNVPTLNQKIVKKIFSYWDVQTDDLALVRRVAASAVKLGASITENCRVVRISQSEDGWKVEVKKSNGDLHTISARYVLNALGPWANRFLDSSGIQSPHHAVNSQGIHLLFEDISHKVAMFLQSPEDSRIFFILPWQGHTLVGTTETLFEGNPDDLAVQENDVNYLLGKCNLYLTRKFTQKDIKASFAGLRWLPLEKGKDLGHTTRSHYIGNTPTQRGMMYTIYGGKLTGYRELSEFIGNEIIKNFGESQRTRTKEKEFWASADETPKDSQTILERFDKGGATFTARNF